MEYTLYLISYRPHLATEIEKSISPETFVYFDGTGYPSFSKLVNSVVAECPTEIVIIMSDKVRPTQNHVHELIAKLNQGYGFVGTYSYAFFGFRKDLMRRIGMFDERYVGGGFSICSALTIDIKSQSSNNLTIALRLDKSLSVISVGLPSRANNSLK